MMRPSVAQLGMPCGFCVMRPHSAGANTATRRWYGDTDGEYHLADYVDGVLCCTTCYQRLYRRAQRKRARE